MKTQDLPKSRSVLLLIDFINPLDFPGAEDLAEAAVEAAEATSALKAALRKVGVPAIYANDNYGGWQSDFQSLVARCADGKGAAAQMAKLLRPQSGDLTILKPRHSAFLGSPLDLLLTRMHAREIIITGLATDICVQLTAMDAFLRDYTLKVPVDCTAAESVEYKKQSIAYMKRILQCDVSASAFIAG
ncbi:MAG: cysteine hydrolase [Bacteroidia bacterium]|nr:cysteine hydrolase [Polaromonas sp.]MCZ8286870.1 cysteine hydrolase [Bacteroidia bacterium]